MTTGKPRTITDEMIRQWILSDESLYLRAREFGGGGDNEMSEKLEEFIEKNRADLIAYIRVRLG